MAKPETVVGKVIFPLLPEAPTDIVPFTSKAVLGVLVPIPMLPELETNNKFVEPEITVNEPVPEETEAVTDPVAICDKFNPVIPEAGILNKLAPDPENDPPCNATVEPVIFTLPENIAGPMFVNVDEPETVKEPVIITVWFNGFK